MQRFTQRGSLNQMRTTLKSSSRTSMATSYPRWTCTLTAMFVVLAIPTAHAHPLLLPHPPLMTQPKSLSPSTLPKSAANKNDNYRRTWPPCQIRSRPVISLPAIHYLSHQRQHCRHLIFRSLFMFSREQSPLGFQLY